MTAANFAGSAARVAVAAPVAVISPEAREVLKRELSPRRGEDGGRADCLLNRQARLDQATV